MSKGFAPILIVLLIAIGAGLFFAGNYFANNFEVTPKSTSAPRLESPIPVISALPKPTPPAGWVPYSDASLGLAFYHPTNLEVNNNISDSTALAGDDMFWVALPDSDQVYVFAHIYTSTKSPSDWWNTEGKQRFEKLGNEVESYISDNPNIQLNFSIASGNLNDKETLEVVVSSNYSTPQTPERRKVVIFQHKGNIIMLSYYLEHSVDVPDESVSKNIISTFQFN